MIPEGTIPQTLEPGETVAFKVTEPQLPVELTEGAANVEWNLVFVNLATRTETAFAGSLSEQLGTISWKFNLDNFAPGPYAWRIVYSATEGSASEDVRTRVVEASVGDDGFLDNANVFYAPYASSLQAGDVLVPSRVDKIFIEIQRPGLPGQTALRATVNPTALIALTSSEPGRAPEVVGQVTGLKYGDALGSAWSIGIDAGNRPLFSADPKPTTGIYFLVDYAETVPVANLRRTVRRGYLTVVDPTVQAVHEAVLVPIIERVIEDRLTGTGDITAYSIGGRNLTVMPIDELRKLRARYKETLARIQRGGRWKKQFGYSDVYGGRGPRGIF